MPPSPSSSRDRSFRPWLDGLSPRCRLAATLGCGAFLAPLSQPLPAATALGATLLLALLALRGGFWRRFFRPLAGANIFFLFLFLSMPLTFGVPAEAAAPESSTAALFPNAAASGVFLRLGPVGLSLSGLRAALLATFKGNAMLGLMLVLPGSVSFARNCKAMLDLGLPAKLVTLLQLVARHILSLKEELTALRQAAGLRGFAPRCSLHGLRTLGNLAAMLLVRAHDKSRRVQNAMRLRGFSGILPLLLPDEAPSSRTGLIRAVCCVLTAALLLGADIFLRLRPL